MGEEGAPPSQQTKELYPPQETFSNGKLLNKQTRVYLMKFLWLHNIPAPASVISELFLREIFEGGRSFGKVVKKMGWDLFGISLVCNYAVCYVRHLIYWVGVAEGARSQPGTAESRRFERGRRDTIR